MKKLLYHITKWLVKKTGYVSQRPIQQIIVKPEELKRLHCQHIVNWFEWKNKQLTPDYFSREFKYQVVNKLMDEVIIKIEETPDGVMYSCDLLLKSI